jgi:A/G-specific adenine glycosylase
LTWFRRNSRDLPWRQTRDPYAVWVSEVMLQQTQVKTVIPYWKRWMRALPTIQALARARPDRVLKLWEGLGYYNRARKLQEAARFLVRQRGGQFPTTFDEVISLPGIGRYTAGAICSIAYNQPTPVLDGNVTRLLSRVFGIVGDPKNPETRELLWSLAEQFVRTAADEPARGRRHCSDLNQALMELGAVTCTPRNPRCPDCPLKRHCAAFADSTGVFATLRSKRTKPMARHVVAFVVERNGRFLVRQRPANVVNGQLWEFPSAEVSAGSEGCQRAIGELFGSPGLKPEKLLRLRHSITRYRITLDVYRLETRGRQVARGAGGRWCSPKQLQQLPFPSAHRRIVEHLVASRHLRLRSAPQVG